MWTLKVKDSGSFTHPWVLPPPVAKPLQKCVKTPKDIKGEVTPPPLPLRDDSNKATSLGCF